MSKFLKDSCWVKQVFIYKKNWSKKKKTTTKLKSREETVCPKSNRQLTVKTKLKMNPGAAPKLATIN